MISVQRAAAEAWHDGDGEAAPSGAARGGGGILRPRYAVRRPRPLPASPAARRRRLKQREKGS